MNVECGGLTPLSAGRLGGRPREPRLAGESGAEAPHSKMRGAPRMGKENSR